MDLIDIDTLLDNMSMGVVVIILVWGAYTLIKSHYKREC